jgi:hypothetical protein
MRKLIEKLANVMAAVAFAEENESDTARELLAEADRDDRTGAPAPRAPVLPRSRPLAKSS